MNKSRQDELMMVASQAAQWLVALEDKPEGNHEDLAHWLLESPLHTQMFLRAAAIDHKAASLHPAVLNRLLERLHAEPEHNVHPLRAHSGHARQPQLFARRWWPAGIAAGFV